MKKIYFSHPRDMDYENEIYIPLGKLKEWEFVFPYENGKTELSRETIRNCDLSIIDISQRVMGVGIEIGWADAFDIPIIFIFRKGSKVSSYMSQISNDMIEYEDLNMEITKIESAIKNKLKI